MDDNRTSHNFVSNFIGRIGVSLIQPYLSNSQLSHCLVVVRLSEVNKYFYGLFTSVARTELYGTHNKYNNIGYI